MPVLKSKRPGEIQGTRKGQLEFLGRLITRDWNGGPLRMGVADSYYDEIEGASGLSLTSVFQLFFTAPAGCLVIRVNQRNVPGQLWLQL